MHCSYSERKHGQPKTCTTCGLKSAWPKDKNSKCICRLCAIRRGEKEGTSSAKKRHSSSHDTSGSAKKSKTEAKHKEKSHSEKHKSSYTSNALASILPLFGKNGNSNTPSTSGLPTFGQTSQEDVIQQLKDKNDDLQRQIMDLNKQLADKHSTNMELEMTLKRNEREYREKEQRNQKLFDTTVGNLQDQIKQLNKDVRLLIFIVMCLELRNLKL